MQINLESINCGICYNTIVEAISCESCGNSFCSTCVKEYEKNARKNNIIIKCPMCNNKYFRRKKNPQLDEVISKIINGQKSYKCKKCNRVFLEEDKYKEHISTCNKIKCCTCGNIFNEEDSFINHFDEESNYQEKLYVCNFILNSNLKKIPANFFQKDNKDNIIDIKIKETKIHEYTNYFGNNNSEIKFDKNKYQNMIKKEYDLIYCGNKDNLINQKPCTPGNEFCSNCMKLNQAYHGLKKHYLINCAGRVCTYSKGTFHCNGKFEKEMKHETGRIYSYDYICSDKNNVCLSCQNMNPLISKYLDSKIVEALLQRDKINGY